MKPPTLHHLQPRLNQKQLATSLLSFHLALGNYTTIKGTSPAPNRTEASIQKLSVINYRLPAEVRGIRWDRQNCNCSGPLGLHVLCVAERTGANRQGAEEEWFVLLSVDVKSSSALDETSSCCPSTAWWGGGPNPAKCGLYVGLFPRVFNHLFGVMLQSWNNLGGCWWGWRCDRTRGKGLLTPHFIMVPLNHN